MKVRVRGYVQKEVGQFDVATDAPVEGRVRRGMKTICDACRKPVTEGRFVIALKKGQRNMIFHPSCIKQSDAAQWIMDADV